MLATVILLIAAAAAPATKPATRPATKPGTSRVIGSVLGKTLYLDDVGVYGDIDPKVEFDARNERLWHDMGRVQRAFGQPLMRRFIEQNKIEVTDEELAAFARFMAEARAEQVPELKKQIASYEQQLAAKDLPPAKRANLEKLLKSYRETLERNLDPRAGAADRDMARQFVLPWKIERALHRKYGGRIIFQQFGNEALDARRKLFEEAENAGDLRIDDPGLRHLFYWYYQMRHVAIDDPKALDPPWLAEPAATKPAKQ
jgi:hypothetical protein